MKKNINPSFVHELVGKESIKFKMSTGKDPEIVYVGRKEMAMLIIWAIDNEVISSDTPLNNIDIEGLNRPKVSGLPVYQVNAENHIGFSCEVK